MKNLLAAVTLTSCLLAANPAHAFIAGPYTADSYTLHLWHLDETGVPCHDLGSSPLNLVDLAGGATVGNASYSAGFTNALNTATTGAGKGAYLSASATGTGNVSVTLANATTGAFTFEALVMIGFNPSVSNASACMIMTGESGVNANRIFQWRIVPKGFELNTSPVTYATNSPFMTFENLRAISGNQATIYAAIPTTGPDAIVQNQWYHVAVTYNGVPSTANNLIMYWTAMNSTNTQDDRLTIVSPTAELTGLNPSPTVSTPFMIGNTGRSANGNFVGEIDEVRISSVARGASGMMFALPSISLTPLTSQFVNVGSTITLTSLGSGGLPIGYQWQFDGTNITAGNNPNISGDTTNSLVISNIAFAQSGTYTLIATNGSSSNSVSCTISVGTPVPGLFNTGVDANGNLLAGGLIDPHWLLVESADPTYTGPNAYVISSPLATYLTDGPYSQWIAPGDGANVLGGNYEYQTSFVLDSENTTNMQLTINWAADNVCSDIILNGVDLGIINGNAFAALAPNVITTGFVPGSNTLICVVSNLFGSGPNPSGFRAELSALSEPQPPTAIQILTPPADVASMQYQNATFSVTAYGSGPLGYQWYFGVNPLLGQTSSTLTLTDLDPSQAGLYSVVVTNSLSTNTLSASLSVGVADVLEWQGLLTADWDLSTTNWYDETAAADVPFSQNLNVVFDDNGIAQQDISLDLALTPNSVLVTTTNANYTFGGGGYLTGNFNLTLDSVGTLIIDTPNTYTGNTIIQSGTLQVGNFDANGSLGTSAISNNGVLNYTETSTVTVPNSMTGSGSLTMVGTGNLILTGNNSGFSGATAVTGNGTLTPRNATALGNGTSATTVTDGSQVYIDENISLANQAFVLGGAGNGNGALHKGGAGPTYLGGPITLTDYAAISLDASSSLFLTNPAAITAPNVNLAIQCEASAICTINGNVNIGSGSYTQYGPSTGSGTVVFTSTTNIWTGGTTILTGAVLQVGDGGNDGSIGAGSVSDGGTLTYLSGSTITESNLITGGGIFNQSGTGRLILSGGPLNSFSGAIHINGNGQVQLANGESLTGSATLEIGLAQADTNRLELTGNNTVSVPISIFPRAAAGTLTSTTPPTNYPDIVNLSGTNTVSPPSSIVIPTGGNLLGLECDSGYLIYNTGVTSAGGLRDFVVQGAGSGELDGPIIENPGDSLNVYVLGSGTWYFNGQSVYNGSTSVSNMATMVVNGSITSNTISVYGGTLGGVGTLGGAVVIASGASLAPTLAAGSGTPIGTLTITNTLTLQSGSATAMQLNKALATSDQVTGLTSVTYGGTLSVTNLAGTLAAGDSFQLFNAAGYAGSFSSITPASPGPGLRWNLSGLSTGGLLRVISTNATAPTIASSSVSGGNLILSGTGGEPGGSYLLLTSTNVATPLTNWTQVVSGVFDGSGNFAITNAGPSVAQSYFVLEAQ